MSGRVVLALLILGAAALAFTSLAAAEPPSVRIGVYSQKASAGKVAVGAEIQVAAERPGRGPTAPTSDSRTEETEGPTWPVIASGSPLLSDQEPLGAGTFWYSLGPGRVCVYLPDGTSPCYIVVTPGEPGRAAVDPAAIAAGVVDRLELASGQIRTSPRAKGLTGAASWFWLDPPPDAATLTVVLGGERVTVTAEPEVEWRFGDGGGFAGSAGVPYRPGPLPAEAVTYVYGTRCLPGDRDRNPYVLASCGQDGYEVEAVVGWRISYQASGPVEESGTLPTRATETSVVYAVSEARAFLVGRGSP